MPLLTLRNVHVAFGDRPVLDGIGLTIEPGERICLLGRNGEGKSTLLRVIAGDLQPDEHERVLAEGTRVARLPQEIPVDIAGNVFAVVAGGLGELATRLTAYHAASRRVAEGRDATGDLAELARAQHELEARGGWQLRQRVQSVLSRFGLDPDAPFPSLSGGLQRRVLLARALAGAPDLLLLDEPTNHLDVAAIDRLEDFLLGWGGTLIFVTHDRHFLRRLATRVLELDRAQVTEFAGDYDHYLHRREQLYHAEAKANARLDKKLAREEAWIRQGIKARRTRNEGRVRQLEALRGQARTRRAVAPAARLSINAAGHAGRLVCDAHDVCFRWPARRSAASRPVIDDFSTTILRGDRVGILGPNGCGKSTLVRLLVGTLQPDSGRIEHGTRLKLAYFDQLRMQLDDGKSVLDNLACGSESVLINGKRRHVIGYLEDFLFLPRRCRQPAGALSGGERNRLLLAKLFIQPANVLVMDEPTNDLDLETLEVLEQRLLDFEGTLLLVTHDRALLDNVVTRTLVFEGNARVSEYPGGYADWLRQRPSAAPDPVTEKRAETRSPPPLRRAPRRRGTKLTYKEQRELAALPARIEELEQALAELEGTLADPGFYRRGGEQVAAVRRRYQDLRTQIETAYARWQTLET